MAEMTAAQAVRTAWKFNQPGLVRFIECQESKAKLMSQQIEHCAALIEQQAVEIAAANARIAELENQKPSYKKEFDCVYEKLKAEESLSKHYNQRAEQAEKNFEYAKDKIAMMGAEIVRLSEGKEQVEAQNKRMREAFGEIANGYGYESEFLSGIAKAALEEKP